MLAEVVATFGCRLTQLFGMTETSGSATFLPSVDHDPSRPHLMRSVGRPFLNIGIEIRRPDMIACEVREPGEIWVKTETRMLEYVNNPIATSVALVDGWYRTGDGGYLDADGYLYLTDRIRDMILSGGENVYPIEVENALREHPAIQEVAVIGLADEFWGEKVAAILEWRAGQSASAEELIAFARARIARFKCPRVLYVSPSLPRTASGKVQRSAAKSNIAQYRQLLR
jgi:acyl-CoA synthetase (AMP-forming)/AMP-acid ligase II